MGEGINDNVNITSRAENWSFVISAIEMRRDLFLAILRFLVVSFCKYRMTMLAVLRSIDNAALP